MAKNDDLLKEMKDFEENYKNPKYQSDPDIAEMAKFEIDQKNKEPLVQENYDPANPQNNVDYFGRMGRDEVSAIKNAAKQASILAKPISLVATPALETVRAPFKYIAESVGENTSETPPIDMNAEYKSGMYPSDRATTTNLLKDIANSVGVKSMPLINSDDAELEAFSNPYNLAGIALDVGLMGKLPKSEPVLKDNTQMAKEFLIRKTNNKELLKTLEDSGAIESIARHMADNPDKYIRPFDTKGTLDYIQGPVVKTENVAEGLGSYRNRSGGKVGQLMAEQNAAVENMPDTYDISKSDLAAEAKKYLTGIQEKVIDNSAPKETTVKNYFNEKTGKWKKPSEKLTSDFVLKSETPLLDVPTYKEVTIGGGLLPNQISEASNLIDKIINETHPDKGKISLIRDVANKGNEVRNLAKQIADESMKQIGNLQGEQSSIEKNLYSIPVEEPYTTSGKIVNPSAEYTPIQPRIATGSAGTITNYEPAGKVVSPEPVVNEFSRTENIPSQAFLEAQHSAEIRINEINQNIADIKSGKAPSGKNFSNLSNLIKEKAKLEDVIRNSDPITEDKYRDLIDQRNMAPRGYAHDLRQQGNKLMSAVGLENKQDMGSVHAAGKAIEYAGANAQNTLMDSGHGMDKYMFDIRNREISKNLNIADLMDKQRITPQNKITVPIGGGKGVLREALGLKKEYINPYLSEYGNAARIMKSKYINTASEPLPILLASFQIPRNSGEILNNKDAVLAKIAQEVKTPEQDYQFQMFKDALDNHPEKLKDALPAMVFMFPKLFQLDKYGRVDGKIMDPMLLQKAQQDLKLNKDLSPSDKALKMDDLINKGELHD